MIRSLLLLSLSLSWVSCVASAPKASQSWWQSLDDTEAPVEDPSLSCRGIRTSDELDRLAGCWAPDAPRLTPMDVAGLEAMRVELRECLLADLPAPMVAGERRARCHQGLAEVLDRRLYQLGWLKAEVTPQENPSAGEPPARSQLTVRLGQRYRIGQLFVATGPSQRVNSKQVIKRAQKAIPKPRWSTQTALEEIHTRVFDTSKFQQVQVSLGEPDEQAARVPVIITIQE
jgi:translocation and assembly module TamA